MKSLNFYNNAPEQEVFQNLLNTLQRSITQWDYFVDWEKVKSQVNTFNTELNILNSIIGSQDIENDFLNICTKYPEIKLALPILIAVRSKQLKDLPILLDSDLLDVLEINDLFKKDNHDTGNLLKFFIESGLKDIFADRSIKNLIDYVTGVEVGMDTNGRKNRTGEIMENLVEEEVKKLCKSRDLEYGIQMTASKIKKRWGIDIPTDKANRRFDIAILNGSEIILIEVNFYRGGGSKLKATAGEYITLASILNIPSIKFVWVTDGLGWISSHKSLEEAFIKNSYIFNLKMLKLGILEEIL